MLTDPTARYQAASWDARRAAADAADQADRIDQAARPYLPTGPRAPIGVQTVQAARPFARPTGRPLTDRLAAAR